MQIIVTGQQVDVTPALRDHATNKLQRLSRYFDQVQEMHVVLSVGKLKHQADATVMMSGKAVQVGS